MQVTHITPRLPPQRDGVGDYAALLAVALGRRFGVESRFLVADPAWRGDGQEAFLAVALPERTRAAAVRALDQTETVMLHYVGYGYQVRGVPFWLIDAVEHWRLSVPARRLITVFHELWSSGPPWTSAFFLSPLQRALVARLLRSSEHAVASVVAQKLQLDALEPGKTVLQPVPPNVAPTCPRLRYAPTGPLRLIFFGLGASRLQAVRTHRTLLRALHKEDLIQAIDVVGAGAIDGPRPSADVALLRQTVPARMLNVAGDITAAEAAERLQAADLFLSFYPAHVACKSGAMMAALLCGCVPVLSAGAEAAPLEEGREFLACDGSARDVRRIVGWMRERGVADLSRNGQRWQEANASWTKAADIVGRLLGAPIIA